MNNLNLESTECVRQNPIFGDPSFCLNGYSIKNLVQERSNNLSLIGQGIDDLVEAEIASLDKQIENLCSIECPLLSVEEPSLAVCPSRGKVPKAVSSTWMKQFATSQGYRIEGGFGKHAVRITAPNGDFRPLPDHPGDLSFGVTRSLYRWITQ